MRNPDLLLLGAVDAAQVGGHGGVLARATTRMIGSFGSAAQDEDVRAPAAAAAELALLDESVAAVRARSRRPCAGRRVDAARRAAARRWRVSPVGTSKPSINAVARCGSAAKRRPGCERKNVGTIRISRPPAAPPRHAGHREARARERVADARRARLVSARRAGQLDVQLAQPRARKLHAQPALLEVLAQAARDRRRSGRPAPPTRAPASPPAPRRPPPPRPPCSSSRMVMSTVRPIARAPSCAPARSCPSGTASMRAPSSPGGR